MKKKLYQFLIAGLLATGAMFSPVSGHAIGNGEIVCPKEPLQSGYWQLWKFFWNGSVSGGFTQITNTGPNTTNFTPNFSKDGNRLYYATNASNNGVMQIFRMNPDGSGKTQITGANDGSSFGPAESPDGSKLAFSSAIGGLNHYEVFVLNGATGVLTKLTTTTNATGPVWSQLPSWTPDGSKIVYASTQNGSTQIWSMNADGSNQQQLTNTGSNNLGANYPNANAPKVAPNGQIVFWAGFEGQYGDVWRMNLDGTSPVQLTHVNPGATTYSADNPVVSPDGSWIIYDSTRDGQIGEWITNFLGDTSYSKLMTHHYGSLCAWQATP
jgi:TolB protein